ncbi:MAG: energy transducer TonB [Ignavibacteriales bacterium]|nr:energy transducer TonB [Ignavibacteriales bacterium]
MTRRIKIQQAPEPGGTRSRPTPSGLAAGSRPPTKMKNMAPVYPPDALAARVGGRGHHRGGDRRGRQGPRRRGCSGRFRMLDPAALEAVKQWEFTPTLLNGVAVPVVMTATVNFVPKEAGAGAAG